MNRWRVVVGGVLMNLALGSLYAWSVFVAPLEKEFGWTRAETSLVFTIAVVTFAITFIFGGRLQDRRGPRPAALIGAVLVSLGFLLTSATSSLTICTSCSASSSELAMASAMRRQSRSPRSGFQTSAGLSSG